MEIEIYGEEERCPDVGLLSLPSSHVTVGTLAHTKKKEEVQTPFWLSEEQHS